jgi:Rieske 2Fe-2S family protein
MHSSDIQKLVARRQTFKSLEAPFYSDQDILDLDMEVIFGQHWSLLA